MLVVLTTIVATLLPALKGLNMNNKGQSPLRRPHLDGHKPRRGAIKEIDKSTPPFQGLDSLEELEEWPIAILVVLSPFRAA